MDMLKLAKRFALLKGTKVITAPGGYRIAENDDAITFVLESGPKLHFTREQLENEISQLEHQAEKTFLDLSDGVDAGEASTAGRALAKAPRKKKNAGEASTATPPEG